MLVTVSAKTKDFDRAAVRWEPNGDGALNVWFGDVVVSVYGSEDDIGRVLDEMVEAFRVATDPKTEEDEDEEAAELRAQNEWIKGGL